MSRFTMVGKKVKSTRYTEKELVFTLEDEKEIKYDAIGECCSESFIEDIDDITVLQDCEILEMQAVSGKKSEPNRRYTQECQDWTFYKFKTTKGYATLSFRNDSNGYYDGQLELVNGNWYDTLADKDYT